MQEHRGENYVPDVKDKILELATSAQSFKPISEAAQKGIDEMNEAMVGFASLVNGIRGHDMPREYYDIRTPREEVLHRKAKEKRAKRKRGGKK